MKWRKWNNIIHRDLGYLCVGLTIIYAISGIAVNHAQDWNPNYVIDREIGYMNPTIFGNEINSELVTKILLELGEKRLYRNHFRPDSNSLQIFVEGNTILVNFNSGEIIQERIKNRSVIREMNFLHLNHPKKLWTYFADIYAAALALLAITGMFVIKGKKGFKGRGKWLIAIGILFPILFLFFYF